MSLAQVCVIWGKRMLVTPVKHFFIVAFLETCLHQAFPHFLLFHPIKGYLFTESIKKTTSNASQRTIPLLLANENNASSAAKISLKMSWDAKISFYLFLISVNCGAVKLWGKVLYGLINICQTISTKWRIGSFSVFLNECTM